MSKSKDNFEALREYYEKASFFDEKDLREHPPRKMSINRCKLLHEYVNRAKLKTEREFYIYKELFLAINGKDYCDHKSQCEQCINFARRKRK